MFTFTRHTATRDALGLLLGLLLLGAAPAAQAQTADDLYQQALRKERTEGDLRAAIQLYEQVVRGADRTLAARALLRIGEAYEKLGMTEAQRAYQRLVRDFAEQAEPVALARRRLSALESAAAASAAATVPALSLRRVWHDPGVDIEGQPTPDGRFVTFVDWETGDLAVRDITTTQQRLLTKTGYPAYALGSSLSRDGRRTAFFWNTGAGDDEWQPQLRVIGMDGTGERTLIENANEEITYITPYEWTPDGAFVLVTLSKQAGNEIALVDTRSGAVRAVKAMDWRVPMRAALSPDGRWIAYDFPPEPDAIEREIYVLAADGSAEHRITNHPANDLHAIFTPDGASLLFSSERGGSVGLWRVRMRDGRAAGEPELVKADMTPGFYPMGFTPGGALFFAQDTGGGDIFTIGFDLAKGTVSGSPRQFVQRYQGLNTGGHFAATGELFAYMSRRNAISIGHSARLVLHDVKTGSERVLPVRSHRQRARPRVSPDATQVLLNARNPRQAERIELIDVASGKARTLVELAVPGALGDATWTNDGRHVLYFRNDPITAGRGQPRIMKLDAATGAEQVAFQFDLAGPGRTWAVSPDGQSIAYIGLDAATRAQRVRVASLAGGTPRDLASITAPRSPYVNAGITWTPDGRHLLYGVQRDQRWVGDRSIELFAVPVAGGEPHSTGLVLHELRHVSFTPEGLLTYTAGPINFNEVWIMEHPSFGRMAQR